MIFPFINDTGRTAYCGPAAIALLTGIPLSRAEHMVRRCRRGGYRDSNGRKIPIRGTYISEIRKVLKRLGCKIERHKFVGMTVAKFVEDTRHAGTFLIGSSGHLMTCSNGKFADNWRPEPIEPGDVPKARRVITKAYKITAPALPRYTVDDVLMAKREPKPKRDIKQVRAEKVLTDIKRWERKMKLAKTKLAGLNASKRRYEKAGVLPPAIPQPAIRRRARRRPRSRTASSQPLQATAAG
jgi:hypothetical protein